MIALLLAFFLQTTTSASSRETPLPLPSATRSPPEVPGTPRQFRAPDVRPVSPQGVNVIISGPPVDPFGGPPPFHDPQSWAVGLPSIQNGDGSSKIKVEAFDQYGTLVAKGIPYLIPGGGYGSFEEARFTFDPALPPRSDAYTIVASYIDDPALRGSARYLIPAIPDAVSPLGNPPAIVSRRFTASSTVFYERGARFNEWFFVTLEAPGRRSVEPPSPEYRSIGPLVVSPDIEFFRRTYLGTNAELRDTQFSCYDAAGSAAIVELVSGESVHIDLIARMANVTTWIANDSRRPEYGCGWCDGRGKFVQSPLVIGFSLKPAAVRPVQPMIISGPSSSHGPCIRGYLLLQDQAEWPGIVTILP